MKKIITLTLIYFFTTISLYSQNTKMDMKSVYSIKYGLDDEGYAHSYNASMIFVLGKMQIIKGDKKDEWTFQYKGKVKRYSENHKAYIIFNHLYLPWNKVDLYISEDKAMKHNGQFYYWIIIGGQTQLAE